MCLLLYSDHFQSKTVRQYNKHLTLNIKQSEYNSSFKSFLANYLHNSVKRTWRGTVHNYSNAQITQKIGTKRQWYFMDVHRRDSQSTFIIFPPWLFIFKSLGGTLRLPNSSVANIPCTCMCVKQSKLKTSTSKMRWKTPPMTTFSCRSCWLGLAPLV